MHALALVVLPPGTENIEEAVEATLAPFGEDFEHDCPRTEAECSICARTFWDWWQIGGRWTGVFDGYEPRTDPDNLEVCRQCGGTGERDWSGCNVTPEWIAECNGCNGCNGLGMSVKWPTEWARHPGDVTTVAAWRAGRPARQEDGTTTKRVIPYTLVLDNGATVHHSGAGPRVPASDEWVERIYAELERLPDDTLLVAVDYHT